MKIQFNENLDYQLEAVDAVVGLFDGQETKDDERSTFNLTSTKPIGLLENESGIGNNITIGKNRMLENLQAVQEKNKLPISTSLTRNDFTIEMETGTGKTYVYLRTIFELNKNYGFTKFVILVPSVAIKEGVYKNYQITKDHFSKKYPAAPGSECFVYDSKNLTEFKRFVISSNIQIMIMTSGAINKKSINNIYKVQEAIGDERPIDILKATKPILIIDEPQKVEGQKGKEAIQDMNAPCVLRYSATHKKQYNKIYCLNAVDAYQKRLVKQIEVSGLEVTNDGNTPYIKLRNVNNASQNQLSASVELMKMSGGKVSKRIFTLFHNDKLKDRTQMDIYKDMYVGNISRAGGKKTMQIVGATIDKTLQTGQTYGGGDEDQLKRIMISRVIKEHLEKEKNNKAMGVKTLTLFFIDKVENYRFYDENGEPQKGKYAKMFEEEYKLATGKIATEFHNGYFSQDRSGKFIETNTGEAEKDISAYNLIMREKEKLLDMNEPLRFIFSHSALNEGWDNPNVFQICYLRDVGSEMARRQTIGRGLRLCVNQRGERLLEHENINRLTVVAPETFEEFASALQNEIESEAGIKFDKSNIKNKGDKVVAGLRKEVLYDQDFINLWNRIKQKTFYNVSFDLEAMKKEASANIENISVNPQWAQTVKAGINITKEGIETKEESRSIPEKLASGEIVIPDIVTELQDKTSLKRGTIIDIIDKSKRVEDVSINPRQFIDESSKAINNAKFNKIVDGVKYIQKEDYYTQEIFESGELVTYLTNCLKTKKSLYDITIYDSEIEKKFAKDMEKHEAVKVFTKLPRTFTVPTPLGDYNPDWAIVVNKNGKDKLYLVAETKGSVDDQTLRQSELNKVKCGKKHFESLEKNTVNPVMFERASKLNDLIEKVLTS